MATIADRLRVTYVHLQSSFGGVPVFDTQASSSTLEGVLRAHHGSEITFCAREHVSEHLHMP